jgi:hypothetical protein
LIPGLPRKQIAMRQTALEQKIRYFHVQQRVFTGRPEAMSPGGESFDWLQH